MELAYTALAGGMAGMCVDSVLFPLDTIKTRLQARKTGLPIPQKSFYRGVCALAPVHCSAKPKCAHPSAFAKTVTMLSLLL